MSRYVVDASVALKWFVPEIHSRAAVRLLDDTHDLLAPDLLWAEFGNVLWKKVRRGEIAKRQGLEIVRALETVPLDVHPTAPLLEVAFEIATGVRRTVYDSLYLALAVLERCRVVTADRRLHDALRGGPFAGHLCWVEDAAR